MLDTKYWVKKAQITLLSQVFFVFIAQTILFFLIWESARKIQWKTIVMPTYDLAFTRYATAFMMHMALIQGLKDGLDKIKYALNHPFLF